MYTWEIEKFLAERNRIVTREEFYKVVNQVDNPQVIDVKYNKDNNTYNLKTSDNGDMNFSLKV